MATDIELLKRWVAGDADAGNQLFERHFDSVYRFFRNKVESDIDELVQKTFLACMRSLERFRRESSFRSYLFGIARNELYRHLRARHRSPNPVDFSVDSVADLGTGPISRIARDQRRELLLLALQSLPVEQQTILELFYWEEMGSKELAGVFEVSDETMRTRLSRARKALREQMAAHPEVHAVPTSITGDLDAWARQVRDAAPMPGADRDANRERRR